MIQCVKYLGGLMEYLLFFNFLCSKPGVDKEACLLKYQVCIESIMAEPEMADSSKDEIALILSQDAKTRKKLCK